MILKSRPWVLSLCVGLTLLGCADQQPTLAQLRTPLPSEVNLDSPTALIRPSATTTATSEPSPTATIAAPRNPLGTSAYTPTPVPTDIPTWTPSPTYTSLHGAEPIPVALRTPDGVALAGALYLPTLGSPFPGVVLSHMGGASREVWDGVPEMLQESGYAVLSYDFRGHGQSDGHLDPPNAAADLRTALTYLRSHPAVDAQRIGLVGASMGGIASVIVGVDNPTVRAVIAISTSPEAAGQNAGQVVRQLSPRPYLAIGCDMDPLTRPERVRQLFEAAGPPKEIVILECAAHANDILGTSVGPQLMEHLVAWLDVYVKTSE